MNAAPPLLRKQNPAKRVQVAKRWDLLHIEESLTAALDAFALEFYNESSFLSLPEDTRRKILCAFKSNLAERVSSGRAA